MFRIPLLSLGVSLLLLACKTTDHSSGHKFDSAQDWAAKFEDPSRDAWQKPDEVIAALGLNKNALVADIGSATGYFCVRLSKVVSNGKVFGIDIESSMVDYLNTRADNEGLKNLTSILAGADDAKIPEPVDAILVVNTFHHIEQRVSYLQKLKASLKPNGTVAIVDFTQDSKMGPPAAFKLTEQMVIDEFKQARYELKSKHSILPEQYFLVFEFH